LPLLLLLFLSKRLGSKHAHQSKQRIHALMRPTDAAKFSAITPVDVSWATAARVIFRPEFQEDLAQSTQPHQLKELQKIDKGDGDQGQRIKQIASLETPVI
jgi:hypothetical protein